MRNTYKVQFGFAIGLTLAGLAGEAGCIPPKGLADVGGYVKIVDAVCDVLDTKHDFVDFACSLVDAVPLEGMRMGRAPTRVIVRVPKDQAEGFAARNKAVK